MKDEQTTLHEVTSRRIVHFIFPKRRMIQKNYDYEQFDMTASEDASEFIPKIV
jgi:hypothetical protein